MGVLHELRDTEILDSLPPRLDIRDIYPPHHPRFKPLYPHIPRSWHPNAKIRQTIGPRVVTIPQDEILLHMVEEVTLTFHIDESSNMGELASMALTNYRLWFVPYKPVEQGVFDDVQTISVGKILKAYTISQKKRDGKALTTLVIENMDGGTYHVILSRISRLKDVDNVREDAELQRDVTVSKIIDEIEWLRAENDFCAIHSHVRARDEEHSEESKLEINPYLIERLSFSSTDSVASSRPVSKIKVVDDFYRQGALDHPSWRLTEANNTYQLCPTYPQDLVVPKSISDEDLGKAADYRSKCRLPVLTWMHPHNGAALCRSSQPRSGVMRAQSTNDTELIWAIRDAAVPPHDTADKVVPPPTVLLHIVDARPEINAKGNALAGKGYETTKQYDREGRSCSNIVFMGIDNIHVVRSSFAQFSEACRNSDDASFFVNIQKSKWLEHVVSILLGGVEVAQHLNRGEPVLVHCSDGWDRTAQLSSLAQIMLDPYYRTIEGFSVLVEKDWCSFGHMFQLRCGYPASDQTSPIFMLFLDAVFQMLNQFPNHFQFNSRFLLAICEAVYSSWFGTFLKNCEKERLELAKHFPVLSVWDALRGNTEQYVNPLFNPPQGAEDSLGLPMFPVCKVRCMQVWSGLYQRASSHMRLQRREDEMIALVRSQEEQISEMTQLLSADQHLDLRLMQLRSEIHRLECLIDLDHNESAMPSVPTTPIHYKEKDQQVLLTAEDAMELSKNETLKTMVVEMETALQSLHNELKQKNSAATNAIEQCRLINYGLSAKNLNVAMTEAHPMNKLMSQSSFRISAPVWQADQDAVCCKLCRKKFKKIFRGRHHCRCCGYVYCGKCSNYFMYLPDYGYHDKVRVCQNCFKQTQAQWPAVRTTTVASSQ